MAALIGSVQGSGNSVTRLGSKKSGVVSHLETWNGSIETVLQADGSFTVSIGEKHSASMVVASGNVDEKTVAYPESLR